MFVQTLRKILFPFSWLYAGIIYLRNKFYDWGWFFSKDYDFPVICVGNLSVGGTGKTPMIEYLIRFLKEDYKIATLSRGYKRKTSGYHLLSGKETDEEVGDEPLQFKTKFPDIQVAVDANRQNGIAQLRQNKPQPQVILLDDAFQHRKVNPNLSILLTSYDHIYPKDMMLPAGNLREPKSGAERADVIVVTKCPKDLSVKRRKEIEQKIDPQKEQTVYFSYIDYANFVTNGKEQFALDKLENFSLVTGIAKPQPLVDFLRTKTHNFQHYKFLDHHNFSVKEVEKLSSERLVLTTEKDFMRLKDKLPLDRLYYLPIQHKFLFDEEGFEKIVLKHLHSKL